MLNALIVGGTGLISTGVTRHLLARGAKVTMYNRGPRSTIGKPAFAHAPPWRTNATVIRRVLPIVPCTIEIKWDDWS